MNTSGKKLIGRGAFSKVWDNGDGTVTIKSKDYAKEALALFIDSNRFPKIERLTYDDISTYRMKKYEKVRGIKNNVSAYDWELYQCLRSIMSNTGFCSNIYDSYSMLYQQFETIPDKFKDEKEELIGALADLSNYGSDIGFEISSRNVFIENGKLIFADCFFFKSQLQQIRSGK